VSSLDTNRLAQAINANPGFLRLMIANMDAEGMAEMQHTLHVQQGSDDFIGRLLTAIHAAGAENEIASAINSNPTFLADMMGGPPGDPAWMPSVIANVVNSANVSGVPNGLLMKLLAPVAAGGLNPVVLAQAMNTNPTGTGQILANLNPTVISNALNANPNLLPDLLAVLDTRLVTDTMFNGDQHLMKWLKLHVRAKAKVPLLGWMTAEANLWTAYASATAP
jgi:hypothetical protein